MLKKALKKILQPFIDDIIKLQTEGVDIYINDSKKNYRRSLLFFASDTPVSALIGINFKKSVFGPNHPLSLHNYKKRYKKLFEGK